MEYLACRAIYFDWTYDWLPLLVTFNHMILCLNSISVPHLFNLISYSMATWLNWIQFLIPYY